MFSNYLLLEANECCGTCDIPLKKCILHCLDGPKFHQFDTVSGSVYHVISTAEIHDVTNSPAFPDKIVH